MSASGTRVRPPRPIRPSWVASSRAERGSPRMFEVTLQPLTPRRRNTPMRSTRAVLALAAVLLLLGSAAPALAQTFVFGAQGEPVQFDPAVITDGISAKITRQVFDQLYQFKGATTEVQPALAEKAEASADGKVWTLQLRKNVKFHDGEPFDAKA